LLHAVAGDVAAQDGERVLLPRDAIACLRRVANSRDDEHAPA
jgi:NAD(P)H-hydrate repair Nnr-like enzyme with NAD(P)H-hydrate dehydratase domain